MVGNDRRKLAVEMKSKGFTYKQIGEHLGILPQMAQQLVALPWGVRGKFQDERGNKCEICGEDDWRKTRFHVHHKGPTEHAWQFNHFSNLLYVCAACHSVIHVQERQIKRSIRNL